MDLLLRFIEYMTFFIIDDNNKLSYKSGPGKYSNFMQKYHTYSRMNVILIKFSGPDLFDSLFNQLLFGDVAVFAENRY